MFLLSIIVNLKIINTYWNCVHKFRLSF